MTTDINARTVAHLLGGGTITLTIAIDSDTNDGDRRYALALFDQIRNHVTLETVPTPPATTPYGQPVGHAPENGPVTPSHGVALSARAQAEAEALDKQPPLFHRGDLVTPKNSGIHVTITRGPWWDITAKEWRYNINSIENAIPERDLALITRATYRQNPSGSCVGGGGTSAGVGGATTAVGTPGGGGATRMRQAGVE